MVWQKLQSALPWPHVPSMQEAALKSWPGHREASRVLESVAEMGAMGAARLVGAGVGAGVGATAGAGAGAVNAAFRVEADADAVASLGRDVHLQAPPPLDDDALDEMEL